MPPSARQGQYRSPHTQYITGGAGADGGSNDVLHRLCRRHTHTHCVVLDGMIGRLPMKAAAGLDAEHPVETEGDVESLEQDGPDAPVGRSDMGEPLAPHRPTTCANTTKL